MFADPVGFVHDDTLIKNSLFSAGHVVVPDYLPNSVSNYPIEVASKQSKKR